MTHGSSSRKQMDVILVLNMGIFSLICLLPECLWTAGETELCIFRKVWMTENAPLSPN